MPRRKETRNYVVTYGNIKDMVIKELMEHQKFLVVPEITIGFCNRLNPLGMRIKNLQMLEDMGDLPKLDYPETKTIIVYLTGTAMAITFGVLWDDFISNRHVMMVNKREHHDREVFTKVSLDGRILGGNFTYLQTYKRYTKASNINRLISKI